MSEWRELDLGLVDGLARYCIGLKIDPFVSKRAVGWSRSQVRRRGFSRLSCGED